MLSESTAALHILKNGSRLKDLNRFKQKSTIKKYFSPLITKPPPPDDEPGPGPAQRPDPEHRGPARRPRPVPSRPGPADAQGHLHGHHELPERVPAHPAPAAGGQAARLAGRSVGFRVSEYLDRFFAFHACLYVFVCLEQIAGLQPV